MRFDGFGRSLLFGAFAALAWGFAAVTLPPVLGRAHAVALLSILTVAAYLTGLGARPRRRLGAGLLSLLLGGAVWLLGPTPREMLLVAAALLSIGRSAVCLPVAGARAWAVEAALTGGGLALAGALLGPSPLAVALAVWSFFLVQSVFFLVRRGEARERAPAGDPFDAAHARVLEVLDSL